MTFDNDISTATPAKNAISGKTFTLATDLDGTFLGGTDKERAALYSWIEDNRDSVGLIFVSGRDPEFITRICSEGDVPWPEYVIGDVGTTIATSSPETGITPIAHLEKPIADAWHAKGGQAQAMLDGWPGLTLQNTKFRHRVSFDLDPDTFDEGAKDLVDQCGLDWLVSDNRFFDILPKGYSKGPALRALVADLGIDHTRVLAAGDTLNDFSLLTCGVPAVAVGNSEAALKSALAGDSDVYHARANGAAGIMEAISALNLHPTGGIAHAK